MFTVDGNPMPLCLPIGSAIFIYLGQVWITQEGMREDVSSDRANDSMCVAAR